jgi:hypothetical protein
MIIKRNVLRADIMVPPFDFIDQMIWENHRDYLYHCSGIVYPKLVKDFYGFLEVIQDEQGSLNLQNTVREVTFRVDAALIGTIIETDPVPFEGSPFPDFVVSPTMEELLVFSNPQHRA